MVTLRHTTLRWPLKVSIVLCSAPPCSLFTSLAAASPRPPLPQGVSSNTRYQVVFGLERIVDEVGGCGQRPQGCQLLAVHRRAPPGLQPINTTHPKGSFLARKGPVLTPFLCVGSSESNRAMRGRTASTALHGPRSCFLSSPVLKSCCCTSSRRHAATPPRLLPPARPTCPSAPCPSPAPPQTIARRIPAIAYLTTLAIRFANNVVGGENFIDMARWAGVQ